jgi:hypothetical protein
MGGRRWLRALLAVVVAGPGWASVAAADREGRSDLDVRDLYERLTPGMSLREVGAEAGGQLGTTVEPVATRLLWNPTPDGKGTAVLREQRAWARGLQLRQEAKRHPPLADP